VCDGRSRNPLFPYEWTDRLDETFVNLDLAPFPNVGHFPHRGRSGSRRYRDLRFFRSTWLAINISNNSLDHRILHSIRALRLDPESSANRRLKVNGNADLSRVTHPEPCAPQIIDKAGSLPQISPETHGCMGYVGRACSRPHENSFIRCFVSSLLLVDSDPRCSPISLVGKTIGCGPQSGNHFPSQAASSLSGT